MTSFLLFVAWLAAAGAVPAAASSSLSVTVSGVARDVDIALQRWGDDGRRADVAHVRGRSASFRDLEKGTYAVVVRGEGPLAVAAAKVNLGSGEKRRTALDVRPETVAGRATFAGKPLAGATLSFSSVEWHWKAEVTTDADGRFSAQLWQGGRVLVTASGGALRSKFADNAELRGGRFDFVVPDRQVRGRITESASGRGVPNAVVFLRTARGTITSNPSTVTDAEGNFLFNAVAPGAQHLAVLATSYIIPDAVDFTTKEGDPPHQVDLVLDSGAPRALRIETYDGHPAAGAELDACVDGEIRALAYTDAQGKVTLPLPLRAEAKIYVIPRDGSFAVVGPRDPDRVTLPRPASSLRIVARTTDGAPLPQIELLMSFNGAVVPPVIARRIGVVQGMKLMTNGDGEAVLRNIPSGWYQFWPYRGDEEAQAILAASMQDAPISLNVKTGENAVAVDFQKR